MADPTTQERIDALNAYEDSLGSGLDDEMRKKMVRKERRKLEARLQREREGQSLDAQDAATQQLDPFAERTPEEQAAWEAATGHVNPNDLHWYGSTHNREVGQAELVGNRDLTSAAQDLSSAYDPLSSAFEGLKYDPRQLANMGKGADYFGRLMKGGRDAVSDAEYARRVSDAEQTRSAQTAAALAAEEARGGNAAGQRVLADQAASAGQINDMYRAGLDASAMAQQRRDNAAQTYFDLSRQIGDTKYGAAYDRAGGLDTFGLNRASGQDAFESSRANALDNMARQNEANRLNAATYNADKFSNAADMNTNRDWETGDANVDVWNNAVAGNAQANANATNTWLGAQGQQSGAVLGTGNLNLNRQSQRFAESQAPSGVERFTAAAAPFISAGAGLVGQTKKWRSI